MQLRAGLAAHWRVAVALTALTLVPAAATEVASQGQPPSAKQDCAQPKREAVLREEQSAVLGRLGDLTVLRNQADLDALAEAGWPFLAHQFTSFEGIGLTIFNPAGLALPGNPNFLFYSPSADADDTTDPRGPDFPYTLAGWGYGVSYTPGRIPSFFPCMGVDDWHIHERGVHPIDSGGMAVMPPSEDSFGASPGGFSDPPAMRPVVGFPHARSWTIHLWRDSSGVPESAILDPEDPPAGIDPGEGSSFYFLDEPPEGLLDPEAPIGRPQALQGGEGQRKTVAGGSYTLKVAGPQTLGNFSLLEADLTGSSKRPTSGPLDHDEGFYVLSGRVTFEADGQSLPAEKGSFVFLPEGSDYSFEVGGGRARVLMVAAPGGIEQELGFEPPPGAPAPPPGAAPPSQGAQEQESRGSLEPYVLQPDEGEVTNIRGGRYVFKARTEDTGGTFTLMEITFQRGGAPPPHIHHKEVETFRLLDGDMTFGSGGQTLPAQAGSTVLLPIGLLHGYTIDTEEATALLIASPAGLEKFFRALGVAGDRPLSARQALGFGVEPVLPPGVSAP